MGRSAATGSGDAAAMLQVSLETGGFGKSALHAEPVGMDDPRPDSLRGCFLFEGEVGGLLQGHHLALGTSPCIRILTDDCSHCCLSLDK